ncbi:MAG: cytochrome c oxidase assembly protein [Xanthomonadales bacterium]|nr:cytochrome c oxidase assembly protein [Xanthomonadales bacterium]
MSETTPAPAQPDHRKVVKRALLASAGAFFFCFSLIPIYSIYCEITGANGKTGQISGADAAPVVDLSRTITVQFDGTSHSSLPWQFKPEVREMVVHPGELASALFFAHNNDQQTLVGQAVPSVAPNVASIYFNKTECFCFTEQLLAPGESREMPVKFVIDPEIPASVKTVTLSYTFFLNELATQRVAKEHPVSDNPAS